MSMLLYYCAYNKEKKYLQKKDTVALGSTVRARTAKVKVTKKGYAELQLKQKSTQAVIA